MFGAWKHTVIGHYGLHSGRKVEAIEERRFFTGLVQLTLSFSRSFRNLTEGPPRGAFGLPGKSGLGLLN
jgi:hypothetical protein